MSTIVKIQRKGQVTIPTRLRAEVGLADGDLMEVKAVDGNIVLTPKLIVDREYTPAQRRVIDARLDVSLEQAKKGEMHGPFDTHDEMISYLHDEANKARHHKAPSRKRSAR